MDLNSHKRSSKNSASDLHLFLLFRYEPPIEMIEDLASKNVIWAGNHVAWIWSIEKDDNPSLQTITRNFRCLTNEQMDETGHRTGDLAFGIEKLQGGEVEVSRWPWSPLHK